MINIAICDDNFNDRKCLHDLIVRYADEHKLNFNIELFDNGFIFLESVKRGFHICFLDIFMPALSGIDTARELRTIDTDMHLVFCTSSKDFALDGYGLQACNYLLKPLDENTVFQALGEIIRKIHKESPSNLCIPTSDGFKVLMQDSISYIVPHSNNCVIYVKDGSTINCKLSFSKMAETVCVNKNFSVISRSVILNFDSVIGMEKDKFTLSNKHKITIPRRKKLQITQEFLDYKMRY